MKKKITLLGILIILTIFISGCTFQINENTNPNNQNNQINTSEYGAKYNTETTTGIIKTNSKIFINYENDVQYNKENCEKFTADNYDSQIKVLFSTDGNVKNFKFLKLQLDDVDENGKISFLEREIYSLEELTSEKPLVVNMTFFGDTPNYGISYVDNYGNTKKFAIQMSGEDSSLLLVDF